jgi:acetyl esterase/lipase
MIWLTGFLAALSLLAVFPAPALPLWYAAIVATEWGHVLALAALAQAVAQAVASGRIQKRWGKQQGVALVAAALFLTPLVRAELVARRLPAQWDQRFGPAGPGWVHRSPLQLTTLFRGVSLPEVRISTHIYATREGQPLSLDLYRPANTDGPCPGVIVVHGGSWHSGSRDELAGLNRILAGRGYLVASIDYRLAPGATFPAQREDVFAAITFLKKNAQKFGLDENRLVLLGRSAGGQVALSAAYAQKDPAVRGVILFYTPSDLIWGYANPSNPLIMDSRKVLETYLGGPPARMPAQYAAASPLMSVNAGTPPTLMIHGGRDELVSPLHNERLSQRLATFQRPFFYLKLPWATHGCDANLSGPSGQLSTYAVERFLEAVFSPASSL